MTKSKSDLRILLLQIRNDNRVRQEEHESFRKYSGLKAHQIDILNVFDTPSFSTSVISGYDALYVGGASEASVLEPERYTFIEPGMQLLRHCRDQDIPVFASCFGFQIAVAALGGEIIRDTKDFEQGSIPIHLTNSVQSDPLFHDTPNPFMAISVHKERALLAPDHCEMLAYTDACCHSFRISGKRFWAFQFHPEVDRDILIERLTIYKDHYTESDAHLAQIISSISETPESNGLIGKFIDRVLLGDIRANT